jgi:dihydropteroate synthase
MREVIAAGADMINDVNGFRAEGAMQIVAEAECALCIMHMQNDPQTMQHKPEYLDVYAEVREFLRDRIGLMQQSGVAHDRLCIDPGFGFGKTLEHNVTLLKNIGRLQEELGLPVLAGVSRKSMIGQLTGKPVERRMAGSLAGALAAAAHGARIVRVHDVAETVDALAVWRALSQ